MLSEEEFKQLALLARLDPEDASLAGLRNDFNKILDFVNKIQEIEMGEEDDLPVPNESKNVVRRDEPKDVVGPDKISSFAPSWEAGHFVVPGVLDQEH